MPTRRHTDEGPTYPERLRPVVVVVAVCAAYSAFHASFCGDDAYITLAFARRFVETGQAAINPGEAINAVSSPGWFAVAVAVFQATRFTGGAVDALLGMKIASTICSFVAALCVWHLASRLTKHRRLCWVTLAFFLADPWLGRWTFGAMEAPAAAAVALLALSWRQSHHALMRLWSPLLVLSVGVLLRPELAILGGLLVLEVLFRRRADLRSVGWLRTTASTGLALLPVLAWLFFARSQFETLLPRTAAVKRMDMEVLEAAWYACRVVISGQWAPLLLVVVCLVGLARIRVLPRGSTWIYAAWPMLHLAFFVGQGYTPLARYLLPATCCLPLLAISLLDRWQQAGAPHRLRIERLALVTAGVAVVLGATISLIRIRPTSQDDTCRAYQEIAHWLQENAQPTDKIATPEIGALAYFGQQPIVDLGGLILPERLDQLQDDPWRLIFHQRPTYSLVPFESPRSTLVPVWRRQVRLTQASAPEEAEIVLYRIDWGE